VIQQKKKKDICDMAEKEAWAFSLHNRDTVVCCVNWYGRKQHVTLIGNLVFSSNCESLPTLAW
jgi:hypothetical protein